MALFPLTVPPYEDDQKETRSGIMTIMGDDTGVKKDINPRSEFDVFVQMPTLFPPTSNRKKKSQHYRCMLPIPGCSKLLAISRQSTVYVGIYYYLPKRGLQPSSSKGKSMQLLERRRRNHHYRYHRRTISVRKMRRRFFGWVYQMGVMTDRMGNNLETGFVVIISMLCVLFTVFKFYLLSSIH